MQNRDHQNEPLFSKPQHLQEINGQENNITYKHVIWVILIKVDVNSSNSRKI